MYGRMMHCASHINCVNCLQTTTEATSNNKKYYNNNNHNDSNNNNRPIERKQRPCYIHTPMVTTSISARLISLLLLFSYRVARKKASVQRQQKQQATSYELPPVFACTGGRDCVHNRTMYELVEWNLAKKRCCDVNNWSSKGFSRQHQPETYPKGTSSEHF